MQHIASPQYYKSVKVLIRCTNQDRRYLETHYNSLQKVIPFRLLGQVTPETQVAELEDAKNSDQLAWSHFILGAASLDLELIEPYASSSVRVLLVFECMAERFVYSPETAHTFCHAAPNKEI